MDNRITPEMARKELARRELQRRGSSIEQPDSLEKSQQAKRTINYATGQDRSEIDTARDLLQGVATGLGKGGQAIASTLTGGYAPTVDMDEAFDFIGSPKKSIGGSFVKGAGEYLPYGVAGGATLSGQLAAGAASGYAQTEPGETNMMDLLPSGRIGGAIKGAGLNLAGFGAGKLIDILRPSKLFRGNLSPEQLEKNLEITKGTETGLGDVIGSPLLKKKLENTLTMTPFSGANESLQRTGKEVVKRGENLLSKMLGNNNPENVPEQVANDLLKQHEKQRTIKNDLYNDFNKEADKQFLDMSLPKFSSKAKEYKEALESTNILKYEPGMKSILSKLGVYEHPVEKILGNENPISQFGEKMIGEPLTTFKYPTAKEANLLKGKLYEYKNMYKATPNPNDRFMSKIFGDLHSALKEDIHGAVHESGNKKLILSYQDAEENYKKNYSKFLDKEIYKYIGGNKNPEQIISDFVKTSPNADLANRITKISNTLAPQTKSSIAYSYFSRALDNEGNLNPSKLGTSIEKLKPNQFKALVPDSNLRNQLKDYSKLQHMNKEAQNLMFNPKTGQRNTDVLVTALLGALGKIGSGNIAALATPVAAFGGGRALTKLLTSPKVRESIVKAMMNNKSWKKAIAGMSQTGAQGISNS